MKAHPEELRQRIVDAATTRSESNAQIAELFNVSERYVYMLLARHRRGESLAPKEHGGGPSVKLAQKHRATLGQAIAEQPDATLEELKSVLKRRHRLDVSINTVWRAVNALGMTVKKRRVAPAKPTPKRAKRS